MQKTKNGQQHPNIQIAVENFGPIEKAEIDLRPLTVFVGESNTGKTYLAALIYALQRIFEGISRVPWSPYRIFQLSRIHDSRLPGPSTQVLPEKTQEIFDKLKATGQPFKFSDLPELVHDRLQSDLVNSEKFEDELRRCFDLGSTSEVIRSTESQSDTMRVSLEVHEENQILWSFDIHDTGSGIAVGGFINEDTVLHSKDRTALQEALDLINWREPVHIFSEDVPAKSYYLPAARSGIMQSHGMIASSLVDRVHPRRIGTIL